MRAPLPDLDALDIEALKALVLSQHQEKQQQFTELARLREEHQAELHAHAQQIEHLKLVVEKLRRMLFGRKSEKLSLQLDQLELQLEEMEAVHAALASASDCDAQPDNAGAKPARKPLPEHLPRQIVTYEPMQRCCPECGGDLRHFGEDVSEQLDYVPESFRVIRHVRPKFACGKCETVVEAPAPSRPIAAVWLLPACSLMFWSRSMRTTVRCIASRRFMRDRAWSLIALLLQDGPEPPASCSRLW
jgi:transposase